MIGSKEGLDNKLNKKIGKKAIKITSKKDNLDIPADKIIS